MLDSFDVAVATILVNGSPGNFKSKAEELIKRVMGKSYYSIFRFDDKMCRFFDISHINIKRGTKWVSSSWYLKKKGGGEAKYI